MLFATALDIRPGITAIIGSGGKTSLLYRLGQELRQRGTVLLCTSTRIYPPQHLPVADPATAEELAALLREHRLLCVGTLQPEGKLSAGKLPLSLLSACADYVLLEADGSAGLPLKAHRDFEPVIPEDCARVIQVLGLSGFGRPIREAAHCPALYAKLLAVGEDTPVSPAMAAEVVEREALTTEIYLNQVDREEELASAKAFAAACRGRVWAGSLQKGTIQCLY